jgi:NhaP-type Na+/H+ and K+/H+ antiporter
VAPLFDARTVPDPVIPVTFIVGVFTLVIPSEFETPESEAVAKVGVAGVANVVLLIMTLESAVEAREVCPPTVWVAVIE